MSILGKLWYGEIFPLEKTPSFDLHTVTSKLVDQKKKFTDTLSPEQQAVYEQIQLLQTKYVDVSERDAFICGYQLAAKMLTEALSTRDSNPDSL